MLTFFRGNINIIKLIFIVILLEFLNETVGAALVIWFNISANCGSLLWWKKRVYLLRQQKKIGTFLKIRGPPLESLLEIMKESGLLKQCAVEEVTSQFHLKF